MSTSLAIALVSPHAWPAYDDLTWRIEAEAHALARRGHRVTILAPVRGRDLVAESRRTLSALRDGDTSVVLAEPGQVRVVPIGRAFGAGRRKLGGPIDLSAALQDVLARVPFDVVHVHEPLAPTPALAALRHARGVTAATFHRPEQVAGVAFVRPFLDRAISRLDVVTAASETVRRAVAEMFDVDATVIPDAADTRRFAPTDDADTPRTPNVVIIARGSDRLGVRFGAGVAKSLPASTIGQITVLGTADAHWRTSAAIPTVLRSRVSAVADWGAETRGETFTTGAIAMIATPEDMAGSVVEEAMARGMVVVAPRCAEADSLIADGVDGVLLPAFSRERWITAITELADDPDRRERLGRAAAAAARDRSIDTVAEMLEARYLGAIEHEPAPVRADDDTHILVDLRVRPGQLLTPRQIVDVCHSRGIGAVAVIGDQSIDAAREAAHAAHQDLLVIVGQQIHSRDGELAGLFLTEAVADGLSAKDTADAIHDQGGLVMVPHPVWGEPPAPELLAELRGACDCFEVVVGPASGIRGGITTENARLVQRFGTRITAGSGASEPEDVGSSHLRMRRFADAADFLVSLDDAVPVQRRRGLRPKSQRERRRPEEAST
jgi:glycosyltransferase involved in cell wall biosynthesis